MSLHSLGGFYYEHDTCFWSEFTESIPQIQAFAIPVLITSHINIHKLEAILLAVKAWGAHWSKNQLIMYTNSTTAFDGLNYHTLKGTTNPTPRIILLLAAEYDITIQPRWLPSKDNALADTLSRFSESTIADLCPHWQAP